VTFLYALAIHPDIQKRINDELDEHIGSGRLPSLADVERLEYFNAALRESMRWRPATPLGSFNHISLILFYSLVLQHSLMRLPRQMFGTDTTSLKIVSFITM
jgi:hypothetical protein